MEIPNTSMKMKEIDAFTTDIGRHVSVKYKDGTKWFGKLTHVDKDVIRVEGDKGNTRIIHKSEIKDVVIK
jgi:small nuclear ribonucleoprotein (snRNP)-like protein